MKEEIEAKPGTPSLRTLERGLDVLDSFCQGTAELSLTEIAAKINLTPSTALRILSTLERRHYLSRDKETKKYQLGEQVLQLRLHSASAFDLNRIAAPYMRRFFELFNESVTLFVAAENQRLCVERIETTHALRHVVHIGDRLPLTRGAGGKALLAYLPIKLQQSLIHDDPALTSAELVDIRRLGYAKSFGERDAGVAAIAAPIFDAQGNIAASLASAGPTARMSAQRLEQMLPHLIQAADDVSRALGYKNNT